MSLWPTAEKLPLVIVVQNYSEANLDLIENPRYVNQVIHKDIQIAAVREVINIYDIVKNTEKECKYILAF